jgi:hypothetical protein
LRSFRCAEFRVFFPAAAAEMSHLWAGMAIGGITLSVLGAGSTVLFEKGTPGPKGLFRDFLIGAIMVAFIMQLLPESATSLIIMTFAPTSLAAIKMGGGGSGDEEVQVGVPKF